MQRWRKPKGVTQNTSWYILENHEEKQPVVVFLHKTRGHCYVVKSQRPAVERQVCGLRFDYLSALLCQADVREAEDKDLAFSKGRHLKGTQDFCLKHKNKLSALCQDRVKKNNPT